MRQPTWGFGVGCVDIPRAVPDGVLKKAVNGPDAEQADRLFQTAAGNATRTRRPIGPNQQFVITNYRFHHIVYYTNSMSA